MRYLDAENTRKETLRHEYLDASNNVRHHGNLRFAQLTLFSAVNGGLLSILFNRSSDLQFLVKVAIESLGLISAVSFLIMEWRTSIYWKHYQERTAELEIMLGYKQYSTLPFRKYITAANATKVIYIFVISLWLSGLLLKTSRLFHYTMIYG